MFNGLGFTSTLMQLGDFIRQNDFEGKKFLQGKTWGKEFPTLKKNVWLIILEKNLTSPFVGKKFIIRGLKKKYS